MRIATAYSFSQVVDNLDQRQVDLSNAENVLTTGKKVNQPSDDPVAAAAGQRAASAISRTNADKTALDAAQSNMTLIESNLGSATSLIQSAQQDLVQAGNGSLSTSDRQTLAQQLSSLRSQLLSVANAQNGNGGYLFGGKGSASQPFVDSPSGVQFVGQAGVQQTNSIAQLDLTADGQQIFLQGKTGNGVFTTSAASTNTGSAWVDSGSVSNPSQLPYPATAGTTPPSYNIQFQVSGGTTTYSVVDGSGNVLSSNQPYTAGQGIAIPGMGMSVDISGTPGNGDSFSVGQSTNSLNVFSALSNAISVLNDPNANAGQVSQAVNTGLTNMGSALNSISSARSEAGQALSTMQTLTSTIQTDLQQEQSAESNATDADMVQAISKFQNLQTGFQAALQSYASVQKLTLFQYLS